MSAKTKKVLAWILSGFLALAFFAAGFFKIIGAEQQVEAFQSWGYPTWMMYPVGIIEMIMAVLIIVPKYRLMGTNLIYIWAIGALFTHIQADPPQYNQIAPNIIFPILGYIIRRLSLSGSQSQPGDR